MIDFFWNIASFIVALGILVTIHEYGHFWVARKMGVKVLRFSVGFGKALWSKTAKSGTEYVVAAIPLGGYVKMLDEREGEVKEEEKHLAFNTQPVLARIAIVIAGPAANFLLAIFVYWWMFVLGVPALKPYLGELPEQGIAAMAGLHAGDEIIAIDGKKVADREAVNFAVARRMGEDGEIEISVRHQQESFVRDYALPLSNWQIDDKQPDILGSLGLVFWSPTYPPQLGDVLPDQAAARAGLLKGDRIDSINGQKMNDWMDIVKAISSQPETKLDVVLHRDAQELEMSVLTGSRELNGEKRGYLGVAMPELAQAQQKQIESMQYRHQYGIFEAIGKGIEKTWEITLLTFRFIGKMFSGEVS
ncbi:MAG: RIP metalloprotease RseP, partial [Gammaproteobacteria bacterium]